MHTLSLAAALLVACAPKPPASQPDDLPDLAPIQEALARFRGLDFVNTVPAESQSREDLAELLDEELARMLPIDRLDGIERGLHRLGMLTRKVDLAEAIKSSFQSLAGAYYDPQDKKIRYLITATDPWMPMEVIAAHELMHALQDQHFDLVKLAAPFENLTGDTVRNDDAGLALRFLVEGEATYIMFAMYSEQMTGMDITADPKMELEMFRAQASVSADDMAGMMRAQTDAIGQDDPDTRAAMEAMETLPAYILHPFYASYMRGALFAVMVKQAGGWEAISEAFRNPPRSSEQVLHPEKFATARDEPTRIELGELETLAGTDWTLLDRAIHGEFYLHLLLRNFRYRERRAARATSGWDGDVYHAYGNDAGETMIVFVSTWDSEADAKEFFSAYRSICKRKYPDKVHDEDTEADPDRLAFDCGEPGLGWGHVARRGREVIAVEGGERELGVRLLAELKRVPIAYVD